MPSITTTTDVATLTAEDITPYLVPLREYLSEQGHSSDAIDRSIPALLAEPRNYSYTLGQFRSWLIARTPSESEPTGERSALGDALAAMRRRERDAKADAHQARQELVNARVALAEAQERAALPFDSSHPYWRDFWLTAARNTTRSGHCPEYDTHAELMGGITRDQFRSEGVSLYNRETVTYTVTLSFTFSEVVDSGEDSWIVNAGEQELARLAYDNRYDITTADVEEEDREEYGD